MSATNITDYLRSEQERKLAEASDLVDKTEKAFRPPNDEEQATIERLLKEAGEFGDQITARERSENMKARIEEARGPVVEHVEEAKDSTSVGAAFTKSDRYQALKEAGFSGDGWKTGPIELPGWRGGQKATVTEAISAIVQPDTQPGILPILTWPRRVADLFAVGQTTSNTVRYIEELANTNAAAGVTEGNAKPESAITFDQKDTTVGKIATFLPVSDEMLEDVDQIESYLNSRLGVFVQNKEDSELLNGAGAPSVTGILQVGSIQTGSALSLDVDSVIDAIFQAMTLVKTGSLLDADAIVINPTDWSNIRLMKDTAKQYYGGGPFTGAYGGSGGIAGDSLWNLPVVVTTAIAAGTVLIGAFRQGAQIFRRRGLTIEASNGYNDYFQRNLTAIRAEERLALVTYRPTAFYKLTGANLLEGS